MRRWCAASGLHDGGRGRTGSTKSLLGESCFVTVHDACVNQRRDDVVRNSALVWPRDSHKPVELHHRGLCAILQADVEGAVSSAFHSGHNIVVDKLPCITSVGVESGPAAQHNAPWQLEQSKGPSTAAWHRSRAWLFIGTYAQCTAVAAGSMLLLQVALRLKAVHATRAPATGWLWATVGRRRKQAVSVSLHVA